MLRAQKNFRAPVPQGNYLVSVGLNRETESSGKTKVRQLYSLSIGADKKILRLEIPVENSVAMEEYKRLKNLIQEALALGRWQGLADLLHVLLEVELQPLKNEVQLVFGEEDFL